MIYFKKLHFFKVHMRDNVHLMNNEVHLNDKVDPTSNKVHLWDKVQLRAEGRQTIPLAVLSNEH